VSDIPTEAVKRRIKNVMQGDCEFDRTQIRREVPTALSHTLENKTAQIIAERRQIAERELL
jgi:hypothetical protein